MKVLVACEFSGIVRDAFKARGHDAWSCDLLPTERPGNHIVGDVFEVLDGWQHALHLWDLMIFHWPCTYMLNSGVRWFTTIPKKKKPGVLYGEERRAAMVKDATSFGKLLNLGIPRICGENPTMLKVAQNIIGSKWSQKIQPWEFGHGEVKATYFWLKNLPPLVPTNIVNGRVARVHREAPSPDRWKNRSRTYQGIADAMAEQWGSL